MSIEKIEHAFVLMEQSIELLQESLNTSFLDAYIENGENILDNFQVRVIGNEPDKNTVNHLKELYNQLKSIELEAEDIRKLNQLLLLKGSKKETIQANHQLTPDSIGFLFVYLIEQLFQKQATLSLLDISSGMGNLLLTIALNVAKTKVQGYGVDIDETLLAISAITNTWTNSTIQLFHQDALQPLLLEPVDVVIGDLPVGYYPNDEKAKTFKVSAEKDHSYAHHLLLEQGMKYVKKDGYGVFLVPANILETQQTQYLKNWLQSDVYIQGIIQLPDELFTSESSKKSILILQNQTTNTQQAKEVLVMKLASLKDPKNIQQFFQQFEAWRSSNLL